MLEVWRKVQLPGSDSKTPTMYQPLPPHEVGEASLKSDMSVKKSFSKLQLLHQSLTGAGDLDPGDAKGSDVTRAGATPGRG